MSGWTEHAEGCPVPSTHDRLQEAHWFLHQMQEHYHDPALFRYSLAAFINAARSITWLLQKELKHRDGFDQWYGAIQAEMRADRDLVTLNDLRVRVQKKESLLPASSARITHLKHRSDRLSISMPAPPTLGSLELLIAARNLELVAGHPQRGWTGEEVGVIRRWSLPDVGGRELVEYAIDCWRKVARVVSRAHEFCGVPGVPEETCPHLQFDYMTLRESTVFAEVNAVWEDEEPSAIRPSSTALAFVSAPTSAGEVLHTLEAPGAAVGWIGRTFGATGFRSVLLLAIGGRYLSKNTAAFFDTSVATVGKPESDDLPIEYKNRFG